MENPAGPVDGFVTMDSLISRSGCFRYDSGVIFYMSAPERLTADKLLMPIRRRRCQSHMAAHRVYSH